MHIREPLKLAILLLMFLGLPGWAEQGEKDHRLSPELLQLATSEDPPEFAMRHNIPIIDSSVKVVILTEHGLSEETARLYHLKEINSHKNTTRAVVPIIDLIPLSMEKEVKHIRRPHIFWRM